MAEELKKFFGGKNEKRVILNSYEKKAGGPAHLMVPGADIGMYTEAGYTPEEIHDHPFFQYMLGVFGGPRSTRIITPTDTETVKAYRGAPMATDAYKGALIDIARNLGSGVTGEAQTINNKVIFQEIVADTLGQEYSTQPAIVRSGESLATLLDAAQNLLDRAKEHGETHKIVLRIPDTDIAPGMGMGVLFATSKEEVSEFLKKLKVVDERETVTTDVMLERFIVNIYSPSITYFITDQGYERLSVNAQILDGTRFVAGTNILPSEIEPLAHAIEEVGSTLAERAYTMGARGFIGFDTIVTPDLKIIPLEANYRETGTTIPYTVAQRAVNFVEHPDSIGWLYTINIDYTKDIPNVEALVDVLKKGNHLFEGTHTDAVGLDHPRAVITYAGGADHYDLVFFWGKNAITPDDAFEEMNTIIHLLGSKEQLDLPTTRYAQ